MKLIISLALLVLLLMSPYELLADNNDVEADANSFTAKIDAAMEEFNNRVDTVEKWVMDEFDELIDSYANRGDIKQVEELQNQKKVFLEQGTFPDGRIFTVMRRRASVDLLRANRFLDNVYETVIEDLTKDKNFNEAKRLQKQWGAVKSQRLEREKEEVTKLPAIKKRLPLKKEKRTSILLNLRHQHTAPGLCSVTCASIVLGYLGQEISPQSLHKMTDGNPFFRNIANSANRLGYPWSEKVFANDPNGFLEGLSFIRVMLLANCPVIVDLSNAFGTNESHVYVVCGFSNEKDCVFILDTHSIVPGIKQLSYVKFSSVWNSLGIVGQPVNKRGLIAIR